MKLKKSWKDQIRGWIPKEPSFPSTVTAQVNQKTNHHHNVIAYIAIFAGVFAAVFLSMSAAYGLGLGSDYATFAAAMAGVMATIVASVMFSKSNQNKPPLTERGRSAAKIIAAANVVIVGIFLGTYFLVNPIIKSAELTLGLWIVLLLSMFLVNNMLYRNFKKQAILLEGM